MFFGQTHPTDLRSQTDDAAARLSIAKTVAYEKETSNM